MNRTSDGAPGDEREFLTRVEVSRLLGVAPNTVTRWAREGRLACPLTPGGQHRFERAAVERLLSTLTRGGAGEK